MISIILNPVLTYSSSVRLEKVYIKIIGRVDLKTGPLLNLTEGGEGLQGCSEETREKLRQNNFKNPRRYWLGREKTEEHKYKISQTLMGHIYPEERNRKISEYQKNKVVSQETKKKISEAKKKNNWMKNRKLSPERCEEMKQASLKMWAERKKNGYVSTWKHTKETKEKIRKCSNEMWKRRKEEQSE